MRGATRSGRFLAALATLILLASSAHAGDAPGMSPAQDAAAPAPAPSPPALATATIHFEGPTFLFLRYSTGSASSLYAAYGLGRASIVVGVVDDLRTGDREVIGGGVSRIAWGPQAIVVALAGAAASGSKYLQAYVVPSFVLGRLNLSGTIVWSQPLDRGGVRELDVDPLTVLVPLPSWIGLGAFYTLDVTAGATPRQRAGPVLQLGVGSAEFRVEWARNISDSSGEMRIVAQVSF